VIVVGLLIAVPLSAHAFQQKGDKPAQSVTRWMKAAKLL
jgi:hypothetical protein